MSSSISVDTSERYDTEENAWLRGHYRGEFHFLRQHGLSIYKDEHREEGRAISRGLMECDRRLAAETRTPVGNISGNTLAHDGGNPHPWQCGSDLGRPSRGPDQVFASCDFVPSHRQDWYHSNLDGTSFPDSGVSWSRDQASPDAGYSTAPPQATTYHNNSEDHHQPSEDEAGSEFQSHSCHGDDENHAYSQYDISGNDSKELYHDGVGDCDVRYYDDHDNDCGGDDDGYDYYDSDDE